VYTDNPASSSVVILLYVTITYK